jgi:hypothetical protein
MPEPEEDLDPTVPSQLIDELTQLTRKKRRFSLLGAAATVVVALAILATLFAIFVLRIKAPWAGFLAVGSFAANALARRALASNYEHDLARSLEKWGDVRAIGPLAEAFSIRGIDKTVLTGALARLLPKVKASDAHLLSPHQRSALFGTLKLDRKEHADFLIVLLDAIAQIGDPSARPYVATLIERQPQTSEEQRLFEAAYACRGVLLEAEQLEQQKQTLLRAADETDQSASLLRPASSQQTDESVLLRADDT